MPGRGAPCLERENAFIFACISEDRPLARDGGGAGLLAALTALRGLVDELNEGIWVSFEDRKDGGLGLGELESRGSRESGVVASGVEVSDDRSSALFVCSTSCGRLESSAMRS